MPATVASPAPTAQSAARAAAEALPAAAGRALPIRKGHGPSGSSAPRSWRRAFGRRCVASTWPMTWGRRRSGEGLSRRPPRLFRAGRWPGASEPSRRAGSNFPCGRAAEPTPESAAGLADLGWAEVMIIFLKKQARTNLRRPCRREPPQPLSAPTGSVRLQGTSRATHVAPSAAAAEEGSPWPG